MRPFANITTAAGLACIVCEDPILQGEEIAADSVVTDGLLYMFASHHDCAVTVDKIAAEGWSR